MIPATKNKGPKACSTCAKAKARCIPGPAADICERCHRLHKSCSSQTPAPPRRRKEPKPTKVAELERRLEDLTSRLDSVSRQQVQQPSPPESTEAAPSPQPAARCAGKWGGRPAFGHLFPGEKDPEPVAEACEGDSTPLNIVERILQQRRELEQTDSASAGSSQPVDAAAPEVQQQDTPSELWPCGEEAEQLLREYLGPVAELCPFVIVPAGFTSAQLRRARPFLWKGIMVQACFLDGTRQVTLGTQLVREISEAAMVKSQTTLDLLQGLQLLLAWFHFSINSVQTTTMLFLMRSVSAALGIGEPPKGVQPGEYTPATLERMRAFLGVYYIVALVFTTSKQSDTLLSTPYLESCCQVLENRLEYASDAYLVQLVRIQQLSQSISLVSTLRGTGGQADLPANIIAKTFQQQLDSYRSLLPEHLKNDRIILGHVHTAEILLYEVGLQDGHPGILSPAHRLEMLWACLNATEAYLAARFSLSVKAFPQSLCVQAFDYMYAFLTALKLMSLQMPGWDPRRARAQLRFDEYLDQQIRDMYALAKRRTTRQFTAYPPGHVAPKEDPFERLARRLTWLKPCLSRELDNVVTPASSPAEMPSTFDVTQDLIQDLNIWPDLFNTAIPWEEAAPTFMEYWPTPI